MRKHRHEHALMLLAVALAVVFAITGCNGAKQEGDAGDGDTAEKVEQTNDGNAGGGGAGGGTADGSGSTAAVGLEALDGVWKVASSKSDLWDYSGDKLATYEKKLEDPGLLSVDAKAGTYELSTIGGNLTGTVKPKDGSDEFELTSETQDGFTFFRSATATLDGADKLTLTIDDRPSDELVQEAGDDASIIFANTIVAECQKTDEYKDIASVFEVSEQIHQENNKKVDNIQGVNYLETLSPVSETDFAAVHLVGTGETDDEFIVILAVLCYNQQYTMINNSAQNVCIVNDGIKVNNPVYSVLPSNADKNAESVSGRYIPLHFKKSVVGDRLTSVSGMFEITTLDWFPIGNIEFKVTI